MVQKLADKSPKHISSDILFGKKNCAGILSEVFFWPQADKMSTAEASC